MSEFWRTMADNGLGNLAEWVGGVGAAGALLLGFYILLRDRLQSDRLQADQVLIYRRIIPGQEIVEVQNTSSRAIFLVEIVSRPDRRNVVVDTNSSGAGGADLLAGTDPSAIFFDHGTLANGKSITIPGGLSHEFIIPNYPPQYRQLTTIAFVDANGRRWAKRTNISDEWSEIFILISAQRAKGEFRTYWSEVDMSKRLGQPASDE